MNKRLICFIILLLFFITCCKTWIQGQTAEDAIEFCKDPYIKTVLLHRGGWDLSMPVIYNDESEQLNLDFDYIDTLADNYNYALKNCTYDWKLNDVAAGNYIDGFNDVSITEVSHSVNTTRSFTHFSAAFPNDDIKIEKSGNYLLEVYKTGEPEKLILTKRFCIAERKAEISAVFKQVDAENQEISLVINLGNLHLQNPLGEIKVIIVKNYDWNNTLTISSTPLLQDDKLVFDKPYQILSPGGNEFRYFDCKSIKFISERVNTIKFLNPDYHVFLKADELRQFQQYFTSKDLNGRYYINVNDARSRYEEADYVYVHFTLNAPRPIAKEVYIYGALTDYRTDQSNAMSYNYERSCYEKTLLLKQGYYNYAYATKDLNKNKIDFDLTEGVHAETENDYAVFVYLQEPMSDFDRLVGFKIVNSMGENK
jgi:hypothetical protein